ncbi:MAG: PepSY-associated TM helix domain-containing protein [Gammaproteobacteria bacterium]|nr:PepSY-associated TM helix domain-containing protein [Gammaproteobacteria bacterium]
MQDAALTSSAERRGLWLRRLLTWHWISSALALCGMLLFAITGITLNNAGLISATPAIQTLETQLPDELIEQLKTQQTAATLETPATLHQWLAETHNIRLANADAEWSDQELYFSLPRPGGDAWLSIDLDSGDMVYELTDRGWIAWLNDLHKGRNTGTVWLWFIDIFAGICVAFCLTGFGVLALHARERTSVWPVTGLGLVIPVLLAVLFLH